MAELPQSTDPALVDPVYVNLSELYATPGECLSQKGAIVLDSIDGDVPAPEQCNPLRPGSGADC
jgi:hypothetical protein